MSFLFRAFFMFSDIVDILFDLLAIKYYDCYKVMLWDYVPILTTMILNCNKFGKQNKGIKSVVCARVGGANTTSILATHFAKRNTKNCGGEKRSGESEGGQKFLPPNPPSFLPARAFSFCSAERSSAISRDFAQNGF